MSGRTVLVSDAKAARSDLRRVLSLCCEDEPRIVSVIGADAVCADVLAVTDFDFELPDSHESREV